MTVPSDQRVPKAKSVAQKDRAKSTDGKRPRSSGSAAIRWNTNAGPKPPNESFYYPVAQASRDGTDGSHMCWGIRKKASKNHSSSTTKTETDDQEETFFILESSTAKDMGGFLNFDYAFHGVYQTLAEAEAAQIPGGSRREVMEVKARGDKYSDPSHYPDKVAVALKKLKANAATAPEAKFSCSKDHDSHPKKDLRLKKFFIRRETPELEYSGNPRGRALLFLKLQCTDAEGETVIRNASLPNTGWLADLSLEERVPRVERLALNTIESEPLLQQKHLLPLTKLLFECYEWELPEPVGALPVRRSNGSFVARDGSGFRQSSQNFQVVRGQMHRAMKKTVACIPSIKCAYEDSSMLPALAGVTY